MSEKPVYPELWIVRSADGKTMTMPTEKMAQDFADASEEEFPEDGPFLITHVPEAQP